MTSCLSSFTSTFADLIVPWKTRAPEAINHPHPVLRIVSPDVECSFAESGITHPEESHDWHSRKSLAEILDKLLALIPRRAMTDNNHIKLIFS